MATLALAVAGAAAGSALLPGGISLLGATISGATVGAEIGSLAGAAIDQSLFGASGQTRTVHGPRLQTLYVTSSTEGAPIPRVFGRARLGGQVIWATNFEEEVVSSSAGGGGKGLGGDSGGGAQTETVQYRYYANFAVALAEGPISSVGRVWADGKELDLSGLTYRVYTGSETQLPDSLISAKEGAGNAPAYLGVAYIVFERFAVAKFGNRLPQLSFEVIRAVDKLDGEIRAVALIPGSGEFVYEQQQILRDVGAGLTTAENVHTRQGDTDFAVSLDQLQSQLPGVKAVSLVVSWFGTDLRAGQCEVRPGVEIADKATAPLVWSVAGLDRASAHVVSLSQGLPAYGGTPSDHSVTSAIGLLRARGVAVTFSPFLLMDIGAGNALANPYTGAAGQPAYPWRGRITVDPAPGRAGSPDRSSAAGAQIQAFVGAAAVNQFQPVGAGVAYGGPEEWSWRRMVLHYATLCAAAGGVDAFVIGSELKGLTAVRSGPATYPFVRALMALAADVKSILGPATKVLYAADWSEYFGHQPADGSGDVYFNLDPLWASPAIDAVGIDVYWPLADWRDGTDHLDATAGARSLYDLDYLKSNVFGGEGYDWYYRSPDERNAQLRTPISDAAGKPWLFRFKDIRNWWSNYHFDRPAGIEATVPTPWLPHSKPIWFMEVGCPAIDKGANQPNVFVDPKSTESLRPYFSNGARDDYMQRRYLQALIESFDPAAAGFNPAMNPLSAVYGGRMVDPARMHVYAWDARPFPAFPANAAVWGDAGNWISGHWLNGRAASAPLPETVAEILRQSDFEDFDVSGLHGVMAGFVLDRIMSAREAIQPLSLAFFFDAVESDGRIRFRHRGEAGTLARLDRAALVETKAGVEPFTLTRTQETDLPASAKISYVAASGSYPPAVVESRRLAGSSGRIATADLAIVLDPAAATQIADAWLHEAWAARETADFTLPPSHLALEPGDVIEIEANYRNYRLRLTEVADHGARAAKALTIDPGLYQAASAEARPHMVAPPSVLGPPMVAFLDLPRLTAGSSDTGAYVAALQSPWPGQVLFYRAPEASGYTLKAAASSPAAMGVTLSDLAAGPSSRWDRGNRLRVKMHAGALTSLTDVGLLAGANAAALDCGDGNWEVLQFKTATLISPAVYELSMLLRGQAGSECAVRDLLPSGARFVMLDRALAPVAMSGAEVGVSFNWKAGPAGREISSVSYVSGSHRFTGAGLRPLSPVHVSARRVNGDLFVSWIRRTRIDGDGWELADVPLGEETERYEVDMLSADGTTVVRTLASSTPAVTITADQLRADFGQLPQAVSLRVFQIGFSYGRGRPALATI